MEYWFRTRNTASVITCLANKHRRLVLCLAITCLGITALGGCVSDDVALLDHLPPQENSIRAADQPDDADIKSAEQRSVPLPVLRVSDRVSDPSETWGDLGLAAKETRLNVDAMPLNEFIQVALGDVLGLSFIVDPAIQARQEPVTLRTTRAMPSVELLASVEQILAGFDVGLSTANGTLEVLPASRLSELPPTFIGTREKLALAQGRVMVVVPLKYSGPAEALKFLRHFMNSGGASSVDILPRLNALAIVGDASRIERFVSVVEILDRPAMEGRDIQMFRPVYWQAKELIDQLSEALRLQGIEVAETAEAPGVYLSEVKQLNSILVAAPDGSVLAWIQDWMETLDQPDAAGDSLRSFVYPVKHSAAEELGEVVSQVLGGHNRSASGRSASGSDSATSGTSDERAGITGATLTGAGGAGLRMVVDEAHNSLVFVGSAQSYQSAFHLLQQLDIPAKQVLLEVTVADLSLENDTQLGVEWQYRDLDSGGTVDSIGGTLRGLGVRAAGFNYTIYDGTNIRARINALATQGNAKILSSPRLLAVDNEEARIQVGTKIAVISSENTSASVDGIIRSFNYLDTGVILNFTPTVMSGDQVRLRVKQEVSAPGATTGDTPPINTRTVETTLIARSGSTIMIGGLISSTDTLTDNKVPFFGDIPVLGTLFKRRQVVDNSTEMVVLITPHIIESSAELESLTDAFRSKMNW